MAHPMGTVFAVSRAWKLTDEVWPENCTRAGDPQPSLPPLSPAAARLLHDVVVSSTRLDVLLLLRSEPARWWSVDVVAATLRISVASAAQALEDLGLGNLLDVRVGETLAYRFAPMDSRVSDTIAEIAALHYTSRDALLAVLPGVRGTASAARRIADAFRVANRKRHE
jgi:hypothetical protein